MIDLNKEAEELFGKHFNGLHYDDITDEMMKDYAIELATTSKHVQSEILKAQIEVLKEHKNTETMYWLDKSIDNLEQQLNQLENEN